MRYPLASLSYTLSFASIDQLPSGNRSGGSRWI
jgi:hypothetical protein